MFTNRLFVMFIALTLLTVAAITVQAGIKTNELTQVRADQSQHLIELNEMYYPSNAAPAAPATGLEKYFQIKDGQVWQLEEVPSSNVPAVPSQNQHLLDLNEMFYPSSVSEPTFWSGQPH